MKINQVFTKIAAIVGVILLVVIVRYTLLSKLSSVSDLNPILTTSSTPNTTVPTSTLNPENVDTDIEEYDNSIKTTPATSSPALKAEIAVIDKIKTDTDNLIKNGELQEKKKEFEFSVPYEPTLKAIYADQQNRVLKYVERAGSDDSALTSNFYYDKNYKLRFTLIIGGAYNGSELEHKIYFNTNGKKILESYQYIKGPGYTFPSTWPEDRLIFDPLKEFNK